jgi:hypothetical protein
MSILATIATGKKAASELKCLLLTLEIFEAGASLYVFTDSETAPLLPTSSRIRIHVKEALNHYAGKSRADMEAMPGRIYKSLFTDYTMEKANVLKWGMDMAGDEEIAKRGIWFLDADICLFAPLPTYMSPKTLALSPHYIRSADERKYGHFNAGMIWIRTISHIEIWKWAALQTRFYEQAALEDVWIKCSEQERSEMPPQVNLGWWRHGQSVESPPEIEKRLGFQRQSGCMGLKYEGYILQSVHTHWNEPSAFNTWIRSALQKIQKTHEPAKRFLQAISILEKNI